jgi:hypothetical protein
VLLHPVYDGAQDREPGWVRNVILVAGNVAAPANDELRQRWAEVRDAAPGAPDLSAAIRDRWDKPLVAEDVPVLTDGYAPTDALLIG